MTNQLKKRLDTLRALAPRLNSVTDETSKIVAAVERTLVDELGIGVSAEVCFDSKDFVEPIDPDDGDSGTVKEEVWRSLAFDRVNGTYRIHVLEERRREDQGCMDTVVNEERTLWPSCDRETKLLAFQELPKLLDEIISSGEVLAKMAEETAAKVKEMTGLGIETGA